MSLGQDRHLASTVRLHAYCNISRQVTIVRRGSRTTLPSGAWFHSTVHLGVLTKAPRPTRLCSLGRTMTEPTAIGKVSDVSPGPGAETVLRHAAKVRAIMQTDQ